MARCLGLARRLELEVSMAEEGLSTRGGVLGEEGLRPSV